jgi:hypothetical protein
MGATLIKLNSIMMLGRFIAKMRGLRLGPAPPNNGRVMIRICLAMEIGQSKVT